MDIPIEFGFEGDHPKERIIRLNKNIYGLKDSGQIWFEKQV